MYERIYFKRTSKHQKPVVSLMLTMVVTLVFISHDSVCAGSRQPYAGYPPPPPRTTDLLSHAFKHRSPVVRGEVMLPIQATEPITGVA